MNVAEMSVGFDVPGTGRIYTSQTQTCAAYEMGHRHWQAHLASARNKRRKGALVSLLMAVFLVFLAGCTVLEEATELLALSSYWHFAF